MVSRKAENEYQLFVNNDKTDDLSINADRRTEEPHSVFNICLIQTEQNNSKNGHQGLLIKLK